MSRRKVIYFLSAFVLIIGCYALNLSYSLFTQNVATDDIVDSTIPPLEASISVESITIEAGKEYLVKQTITNNSLVPINYSISSDNLDKVSIATNTVLEDNTLLGIAPASDNKDIFLVISNNCETCTTDINVNFDFKYNYTTVNDETIVTNIINTKEVSLGGLPYSDKPNTLSYHIINNFVKSDLYDGENNNDINAIFSSSNKVELPLSSSVDLDVPSPTTFTNSETREVGLYKAEDDYGISYYFRGASSTNYVSFAGFTWRIVRINGDGSVRLILDGTLDGISGCDDSDSSVKFCTTSAYNSFTYNAVAPISGGNVMMGYMYGTRDSNVYNDVHENTNNSTIKVKIDAFYEKHLAIYKDYFSNALFCGDKSVYSGTGAGRTATSYMPMNRLLSDNAVTPTLECAKNETNDFSRYTVSAKNWYDLPTNEIIGTNKGVKINNSLTYPIALLSADELVMAGAYKNTFNNDYYLRNYYTSSFSENWWTMSPYRYNAVTSASDEPIIIYAGMANVSSFYNYSITSAKSTQTYGIRPVINLKSTIEVVDGDGTKANPYILSNSDDSERELITFTIQNNNQEIVYKGTTFKMFLEQYKSNSTGTYYMDEKGNLEADRVSVRLYNCYSESGKLAFADQIIESGNYTCSYEFLQSG